jgi:hypothetical protein
MTIGGDDQIKAVANLCFVNTVIKYVCLVESILLLGLLGVDLVLMNQVRGARPIPIFINTDTGTARAVDFKAVDASGESRHESEITDFVTNFVQSLYTFNKFTVRTNLEHALALSAPEAGNAVKLYWEQGGRPQYLGAGYQGLSDIRSVLTLATAPDIRVQVFFSKRTLNGEGDVVNETHHMAVLRIRTILRQVQNAHGLCVVEYRENQVAGERQS